jgi:hypothetical protein
VDKTRRKFIPTYYHLAVVLVTIAVLALAIHWVTSRRSKAGRTLVQGAVVEFDLVPRGRRVAARATVGEGRVDLKFTPALPVDDENLYLAGQTVLNEILDVRVVVSANSMRKTNAMLPNTGIVLDAVRYVVASNQGLYVAVRQTGDNGVQALTVWVGP